MNRDIGDNKKPCHRDITVSSIGGYPSKWTSLPLLVVFCILDKLLEPIDHVRFAAICKDWLGFSIQYNDTTQRWRKVLPMLMIPTESEGETSTTNQSLVYSISEGKIYNNIQIPVPDGMRYCGSTHGWVAIVDLADEDLIITLLDPFRKAVEPIYIPRLDYEHLNPDPECWLNPDEYEHYVPKVILSADPHLKPKNYCVILFYHVDLRLAFYKGGQEYWTCLNKKLRCISDAIFYKSQVYTVGRRGRIMSYDIKGSNNRSRLPKAKLLTRNSVFGNSAIKAYLVESTKGDMLHVRRILKPMEGRDGDMMTESFKVYQVVFDDKDGSIVQQVEVESIGDEALFVGDNHSVSVLASKFPGCQPNSIYYTEDLLKRQHPDGRPFDVAVYNLENETIARYYSPNSWHKGMPHAAWICPQFNGLC